MVAGRYNLVIEQGADFARTFTWKDENGDEINLTGYSARMKISQVPGGTEIVSLTNGSGITLGGAAGTVAVSIAAAATAAYTFDQALYDLEVVSGGGVVTRLVEGEVWLSPEITDA
jgi:hypothetical protein